MSAEEAVFVQMERVGLLRGYSGRLRRALQSALTALSTGDRVYAEMVLRDALEIPNPDQP
jgi:hypothetical protein